MVQLLKGRPTALSDGEKDCVNCPISYHSDDVRPRLAMQERKPTSACRIQPGALFRGDHSSNHRCGFGGLKGSAHNGLRREMGHDSPSGSTGIQVIPISSKMCSGVQPLGWAKRLVTGWIGRLSTHPYLDRELQDAVPVADATTGRQSGPSRLIGRIP